MKQSVSILLGAAAVLVFASAQQAPRPTESGRDGASGYRFSGPYAHANLSVYLIHGPDRLDAADVVPLHRALEQRMVVVHETGNVSELAVENLSPSRSVFIQAGDIVKGGRQDRVLTYDLVLGPRSGKVPIGSFCVERGRWQPRGQEGDRVFSSSAKRLNTKALRLAAQSQREQGKVWQEVSAVQDKLGRTVGSPVQAASSATSLQLSLESAPVERSIQSYRRELEGIAAAHPDAIGFAFAVNGELNSAEVYGASSLFVQLWPKLLESAASEAVAEGGGAEFASPSESELREFLLAGERAPLRETKREQQTEVRHLEDGRVLYVESRSSLYGQKFVHRGYIKK